MTYLEECRDELFEGLIGETYMWDFVVARVAIDFRSELRLEDGFADVIVRVVRIGSSSITLREEIRKRGSDEVAAEVETVMVARDPETGRSRPLNDAERAACESMLEPL